MAEIYFNPLIWHTNKKQNPPNTVRFQNIFRQFDNGDAGTGGGREDRERYLPVNWSKKYGF